jgi:stage II sporulation protein AA (anti-sigma F factor antagonist)
MILPNVEVSVDHGHAHVVIRGEIDLDNASLVEAKIHTAVNADTSAVTVDLSGVTYIDSVGMRVLFMLAARLSKRDVPFAIIAEPGTIPTSISSHAPRSRGARSSAPSRSSVRSSDGRTHGDACPRRGRTLTSARTSSSCSSPFGSPST